MYFDYYSFKSNKNTHSDFSKVEATPQFSDQLSNCNFADNQQSGDHHFAETGSSPAVGVGNCKLAGIRHIRTFSNISRHSYLFRHS